jgi:hypothetical protein
MGSKFELFLFSKIPAFIQSAVNSGVAGIIIDWENLAKEGRQRGFDTQINNDTLEDLIVARSSTTARLICRINSYGEHTRQEVAQAISAGADEILLPMVRTKGEVEEVLDMAGSHCQVGILIETKEAMRNAGEFDSLPLSRVYVGLNDLSIERRTPNIFTAVSDGTVERIRQMITAPFGFGGLTLPDRGSPIPCRLLIGEMARLGCTFSFLRRSFHRDILGREMSVEIPRIQEALDEAFQRTEFEIERYRQELVEAIASLSWVTS